MSVILSETMLCNWENMHSVIGAGLLLILLLFALCFLYRKHKDGSTNIERATLRYLLCGMRHVQYKETHWLIPNRLAESRCKRKKGIPGVFHLLLTPISVFIAFVIIIVQTCFGMEEHLKNLTYAIGAFAGAAVILSVKNIEETYKQIAKLMNDNEIEKRNSGMKSLYERNATLNILVVIGIIYLTTVVGVWKDIYLIDGITKFISLWGVAFSILEYINLIKKKISIETGIDINKLEQ